MSQPSTEPHTEQPPGGGPIHQATEFFHRHWHRGKPGTETPEWVLRFAYRTWLVALLFKLIGSSWDMSWHFRWLRDEMAPPHLINTVGTVMVCALVIIHSYTGMGCDKRSLRLMQIGTAAFLIAAPLDVINHRISGLDLTAWSGTHMLLYIGTGIMIAGCIDAWLKFSRPGRARTLTLGALWVFFLENMFFPNGQQEYGILSLRAWQNGTPDAEPELLSFAANQLGRPVDEFAVQRFALPIEDWVYPVWGIGVMALVLALARATTGARWTATLVAAAYVAYRAAIWPLLVGGGFPPSTVPFFLLAVGLAVDATFLLARGNRLLQAAVGAVGVTAAGFAAVLLQSRVAEWVGDSATASAPPVNYWMAPVVLAGVFVLWACAEPLAHWWRDRHGGKPADSAPTAAV